MKGLRRCLLAVIFVLVLAFAASAIHEIIPSETQVPEPGPDAEKLNAYIVKYNPYTAWRLWPGKERLSKGSEPHGALLTTFVNPEAYFSIKDKKGMAYGSIIVTESYKADKKFDSLTVMYRIKGYNPEGGDWFWAKYAADGKKAIVSGRVQDCINCHGKKKENDYVMTGDVKKK